MFSIYIPEFLMNIITRFHKAGFEAYVVGGAIRDVILHRPAVDWDVATSASRHKIRALFPDIRNFYLKHGTVTLIGDGSLYEVTPMKGNGSAANSIEKDLKHRDFTINAMAYDVAKRVLIDPWGGLEDIRKKLIRSVGRPENRFNEDPLRLLRGVRLALELGFKIEKGTMDGIKRLSGLLESSAKERIRDELMKMLVCRRPSRGFDLLRRSGLLEEIIPELLEGFLKRQNRAHKYTVYRHIMETVDTVEPDPVLRLVALFHDIGKPRVRQKIGGDFRFFGHAEKSACLAREIMQRLRFSRDIINRVTKLISMHMIGYNPEWSDGAVRRLMRRAGPYGSDKLILFRKADLSAHGYKDDKLELILELEERVRHLREEGSTDNLSSLAVDGNIVMEILGISPGPEVGRVLDMLLEKVTDQPRLNTKQGLTAILKDIKSKVD